MIDASSHAPARPAAASTPWWRDAVVYQVYVKSFADSDGDGLGDLDGVTSRLDYLVELGVDALWLNPCYVSPERDGGYDVADYMRIGDVYGGNDALDRLLVAAHERGLRVLLDVVPNHCSVEHAWFRRALAEDPGGADRTRFFFRDGRGPSGDEPPNNWQSLFGGPAWTRIPERDGSPGQWYLHVFDSGQPDFDWTHPEVRGYFEEVLRFWFDRGVDGFRIDVAHGLVKAPGLPDLEPHAHGSMLNQPEVHDVYRDWRTIAEEYGPDRELVFVGEAWAPTADDTAAFVRSDELHQTFSFDLVRQTWEASAFRESVERALDALDGISGCASPTAAAGTYAWTLNNHDIHRAVSRYGIARRAKTQSRDSDVAVLRPRGEVDLALGQARARAAALFVLGLPGSIYLYQGEELGLPEVLDLPNGARQDPIWTRSHGTDPGRDGCRVPIPWTDEGPSFGFSPAGATTRPWLPQPSSFGPLAAGRQAADPASTLSLYREALRRRRELLAGSPEQLDWLDARGRDDVVAYARGSFVCVTVFGSEPFHLPADWGELELASGVASGRELRGPCSAWLSRR